MKLKEAIELIDGYGGMAAARQELSSLENAQNEEENIEKALKIIQSWIPFLKKQKWITAVDGESDGISLVIDNIVVNAVMSDRNYWLDVYLAYNKDFCFEANFDIPIDKILDKSYTEKDFISELATWCCSMMNDLITEFEADSMQEYNNAKKLVAILEKVK